jgi:pimeloyl-ACP methyl ester carboxylesterase
VASYGRPVSGYGDSAATLRTSTLADELRVQLSPSAHVIGFSLKARAAIPLAGHRPDAVAWFDDSGAWVTSTALSQKPLPEVADFIRRRPVEEDFGKILLSACVPCRAGPRHFRIRFEARRIRLTAGSMPCGSPYC